MQVLSLALVVVIRKSFSLNLQKNLIKKKKSEYISKKLIKGFYPECPSKKKLMVYLVGHELGTYAVTPPCKKIGTPYM